MANITMRGRDALSAKMAQCFITIGGRRYNFMSMINFEAKFEKKKTEVPILGQTGMGHKASGWSGTGSGKSHYNTSVMRKYFEAYKNTGEDVYAEILVTNEDKTSAAGRQTVVFTGVNFDGGVLAKFDASGEYLDEDINFTFDDFYIPETFRELDGM